MPKLLRNILAVIVGTVIGSAVNMALILAGPSIIAPPVGVDMSNADGVKAGMHLLEARHFAMPLLAHAIGTLVGAVAAYLIAATHKVPMAYVIAVVFLAGGIAASFMIPAPAWFIALDLLAAYLPMAWVATRIGARMGRAGVHV